MKKLFLLLAVSLCQALTIPHVSVPYIIDSAITPQVRYIDANDAALQAAINIAIDSLNAHIQGYGIYDRIISNGDMNATIDADNNQTGKSFSITSDGRTDTLWKVGDNHVARTYGGECVDGAMAINGNFLSNGLAVTDTGINILAFRPGSEPRLLMEKHNGDVVMSSVFYEDDGNTVAASSNLRFTGSVVSQTSYLGGSGLVLLPRILANGDSVNVSGSGHYYDFHTFVYTGTTRAVVVLPGASAVPAGTEYRFKVFDMTSSGELAVRSSSSFFINYNTIVTDVVTLPYQDGEGAPSFTGLTLMSDGTQWLAVSSQTGPSL